MIKELRLVNCRAFRDVTIPFERLTMIVGPNGVGKTTILEVIQEEKSYTEKKVMNPGQMGSHTQHLNLVASPWSKYQRIERNTKLSNIQISFTSDKTSCDWEKEKLPSLENVKNLDSTKSFQFDIGPLRKEWPAAQPIDELAPNGEGIAGRLFRMRNNKEEDFLEIIALFKGMFPQIKKITPIMTSTNPSMIKLEFQRIDENKFGTDQIGEGMLFVLAIIVAVYESQATVLLFDDIDRGLHPKAQLQLVELLKKLLEKRTELQIIATTHSPSMVDNLNGDQVIMLSQDITTGETKAAPLSKHPKYETFKGTMSPADWWGNLHEDWVLKLPNA